MRTLISTLILALGLLLCACPAEETVTPDTTEEAVADGHEGHDHGAHGHHHGDKAAKPWAVLHEDAVNRSVENIDNGVKMIFTSDCTHHQGLIKDGVAAKIEHMTAKKEGDKPCKCAMHAEGVTVASEEVEKGTAMVFTSEDAEQVKALQEDAAKKLEGGGCGCGGHGEHGHKGHDHGDKPCADKAEGEAQDCSGEEKGEDCGCEEDEKEAAPAE